LGLFSFVCTHSLFRSLLLSCYRRSHRTYEQGGDKQDRQNKNKNIATGKQEWVLSTKGKEERRNKRTAKRSSATMGDKKKGNHCSPLVVVLFSSFSFSSLWVQWRGLLVTNKFRYNWVQLVTTHVTKQPKNK